MTSEDREAYPGLLIQNAVTAKGVRERGSFRKVNGGRSAEAKKLLCRMIFYSGGIKLSEMVFCSCVVPVFGSL